MLGQAVTEVLEAKAGQVVLESSVPLGDKDFRDKVFLEVLVTAVMEAVEVVLLRLRLCQQVILVQMLFLPVHK